MHPATAGHVNAARYRKVARTSAASATCAASAAASFASAADSRPSALKRTICGRYLARAMGFVLVSVTAILQYLLSPVSRIVACEPAARPLSLYDR